MQDGLSGLARDRGARVACVGSAPRICQQVPACCEYMNEYNIVVPKDTGQNDLLHCYEFYDNTFHCILQYWKQVGPVPTLNADGDIQLAFQPSSSLPYVAFLKYIGDSMDDSWFSTVSVMRLDGNKWVPVGPTIVTLGDDFSLAFNPNTSVPYVAYSTCDSIREAFTVVRFTGSTWAAMASAGIPKTYACNGLALAFQPNTSAPYVAFEDSMNQGAATVMRFTGKKWITIGPAGFSAGEATGLSLVFQPNSSIPYVAYQEGWYKATVMRFTGSQWVAVGSTGFTAGAAEYLSMAFKPATSEPYVAYSAAINSNKITVLRFSSSSTWLPVGRTGFSYGAVRCTSLAFNPPSSEPYVAFSAAANYGRATVMRFTGGAWVTVGPAGFSAEQADHLSLVFNPRTSKPYVSYRGPSAVKVMNFIGP